jgi:hypothetical protein
MQAALTRIDVLASLRAVYAVEGTGVEEADVDDSAA